MNRRAAAAGVAGLALVFNIVFQRLVMNSGVESCTLIPGLADFRPTFNRGVSFGLFAQDSDTGRYLLMALLLAISVAVAVMMWRAPNKLAAIGFGLVLGGALGNLMDRVLYRGAVFDFLSLHLGSQPLFICNLADIFISAGVVLLALESLLEKQPGARDFADWASRCSHFPLPLRERKKNHSVSGAKRRSTD